jgi:hypothetical protein
VVFGSVYHGFDSGGFFGGCHLAKEGRSKAKSVRPNLRTVALPRQALPQACYQPLSHSPVQVSRRAGRWCVNGKREENVVLTGRHVGPEPWGDLRLADNAEDT